MSKETLKLALDELKHIKQWCLRSIGIGLVNENVLAELEEALAKQEEQTSCDKQGEPVSFDTWYGQFHSFVGKGALLYSDLHCAWEAAKLYTTPQQRTWVGLTDGERYEIANVPRWSSGAFVEATEAKLKEKNT